MSECVCAINREMDLLQKILIGNLCKTGVEEDGFHGVGNPESASIIIISICPGGQEQEQEQDRKRPRILFTKLEQCSHKTHTLTPNLNINGKQFLIVLLIL